MLLIYISEIVVSDSGTAFTGIEFSEFMARNGIRHLRTAPYHTVNNGFAEHAVQMFKTAMRKSSNGSIDARFLFHYRTTPNSITGVSPDELLMGSRIHLDQLRPHLATKVYNQQQSQKRVMMEKTTREPTMLMIQCL